MRKRDGFNRITLKKWWTGETWRGAHKSLEGKRRRRQDECFVTEWGRVRANAFIFGETDKRGGKEEGWRSVEQNLSEGSRD